MLEVNAIYFILLVEAFGLLLFLILLWILIAVFRLRRKGRAVRELAASFRKRGEQRSQQTGTFLQAVYQLEGEELRAAMENIDKQESEFCHLLIACLQQQKGEQIGALEIALDRLTESYKCLQPRAETVSAEAEQEVLQEITSLRSENDELRGELSVANTRLSDMLAEFGNMFGGGKDHELDLHQLKKKLATLEAESEVDISL